MLLRSFYPFSLQYYMTYIYIYINFCRPGAGERNQEQSGNTYTTVLEVKLVNINAKLEWILNKQSVKSITVTINLDSKTYIKLVTKR